MRGQIRKDGLESFKIENGDIYVKMIEGLRELFAYGTSTHWVTPEIISVYFITFTYLMIIFINIQSCLGHNQTCKKIPYRIFMSSLLEIGIPDLRRN